MNYSSYIHDGTLCWTLTSNGYKYLTWNFVKHWRVACPSVPLLIVCADKPSYQFLQGEGISCRLVDQGVKDYGIHIIPFKTAYFAVLNRMKLRLLHMFANDSAVKTCIYLDGDICVYRSFLHDVHERLLVCPLLFQCDENERENECSKPCKNVCTGLIAWLHGNDNGIFILNNEDLWKQTPEDQAWVNTAIKVSQVPYDTLPREFYPNGVRLTHIKRHPELLEKAYLSHYNYRIGNSKIADMRKYGDWLLPHIR